MKRSIPESPKNFKRWRGKKNSKTSKQHKEKRRTLSWIFSAVNYAYGQSVSSNAPPKLCSDLKRPLLLDASRLVRGPSLAREDIKRDFGLTFKILGHNFWEGKRISAFEWVWSRSINCRMPPENSDNFWGKWRNIWPPRSSWERFYTSHRVLDDGCFGWVVGSPQGPWPHSPGDPVQSAPFHQLQWHKNDKNFQYQCEISKFWRLMSWFKLDFRQLIWQNMTKIPRFRNFGDSWLWLDESLLRPLAVFLGSTRSNETRAVGHWLFGNSFCMPDMYKTLDMELIFQIWHYGRWQHRKGATLRNQIRFFSQTQNRKLFFLVFMTKKSSENGGKI